VAGNNSGTAPIAYAELHKLWKADEDAYNAGRYVSDAEFLIWMGTVRLHQRNWRPAEPSSATRLLGGLHFCGETGLLGGLHFCDATRLLGGLGFSGATRLLGGLPFCGATGLLGGLQAG
jgi:hypothetical protein